MSRFDRRLKGTGLRYRQSTCIGKENSGGSPNIGQYATMSWTGNMVTGNPEHQHIIQILMWHQDQMWLAIVLFNHNQYQQVQQQISHKIIIIMFNGKELWITKD